MNRARHQRLLAGIAVILVALPAVALAHGGVVAENDQCILRIGYLEAHFRIFVPQRTGTLEYCEDIPVRGQSLFVMEYLHDSLDSMLLSFRIIRNTTGKGSYARLSDVNALPDLDAVTVYYEAPAVAPDVFMLMHDFAADGDFIGIVTAGSGATGEAYTAVFPFAVGPRSIGAWPWIVLVLLALQLNYFYWRRRRPRMPAAALAALLLVFAAAPAGAGTVDSDAGNFAVRWTPSIDPITVNRLHAWDIEIRDAAGNPVSGATIDVAGGMPGHDHGLATTPRVTATGDAGHYRIAGLRFHMPGNWRVTLTIRTAGHTDRVDIRLSI